MGDIGGHHNGNHGFDCFVGGGGYSSGGGRKSSGRGGGGSVTHSLEGLSLLEFTIENAEASRILANVEKVGRHWIVGVQDKYGRSIEHCRKVEQKEHLGEKETFRNLKQLIAVWIILQIR